MCFQADGELYLHRQMEKSIVELLKVKMPGLIRLNFAAGGGNDVQLHSGFVLLIGVGQVQCRNSLNLTSLTADYI